MIEYYYYMILCLVSIFIFAVIVSNSIDVDVVSSLHYSLLMTMTYHGLASIVMSYSYLPLSFVSLNWALVVEVVFLVIVVMRLLVINGVNQSLVVLTKIDKKVIFAFVTSYIAAAIAGLLFFSVDLVPSSMTGDPARHFLAMTDLAHPGLAMAMKPIYFLWAGIVSHLPLPLAQDKLFLLFNMFSLGLVTGNATLLMIRIVGKPKYRDIALFVLLTAFGFPFFALQYGYYLLLLGSAFLFGVLSLMLDVIDKDSTLGYVLMTILSCGVILTHSYLVPDLFLIVVYATVWQSRQLHVPLWRQVSRHLPYWIFAAFIVVMSNSFFQKGDQSSMSLGDILQLKGAVSNDFFFNIVVTGSCAAPFWFFGDKSRCKQFLSILILCVAVFSLIMSILYILGVSSPYYVNRNQLVLLPLLIIGVMVSLHDFDIGYPVFTNLIRGLLFLLVVAPYAYYINSPLALSKTTLIDLFNDNSGFVYFVNAKTASYSPLQFTNSDRKFMIYSSGKCFDRKPQKMAVLGTDQQVIWFGIYADLYPSLFIRDDMFCSECNYLTNYNMWSRGVGGKYIAIIKHTNSLIPRFVLRKIRTGAKLVCQGDSFAIYRKLPARLGMELTP